MRSRSAQIRGWIITRPKSDDGATMVEYGLMVGLIALVAVARSSSSGGQSLNSSRSPGLVALTEVGARPRPAKYWNRTKKLGGR